MYKARHPNSGPRISRSACGHNTLANVQAASHAAQVAVYIKTTLVLLSQHWISRLHLAVSMASRVVEIVRQESRLMSDNMP